MLDHKKLFNLINNERKTVYTGRQYETVSAPQRTMLTAFTLNQLRIQ